VQRIFDFGTGTGDNNVLVIEDGSST